MHIEKAGTRPRALFYCHDTIGLGHFRRTLLISQGLKERFPDLSTLIVTGSAAAHRYRLPQSLDFIKLPSVIKVGSESYRSRFLPIPFDHIWALRRDIIRQVVNSYKPDLFFVDNVPCGMQGEIRETLDLLKRRSGSRTFLILRDILDCPETLTENWRQNDVFELLERSYDGIFVCGQPAVFDPVVEYGFPGTVAARTRYCGYIPRPCQIPVDEIRNRFCPRGEKLVFVTAGGGSDGETLIRHYLNALPRLVRRQPISTLIFFGPEMDASTRRRFEEKCRHLPGVTTREFSRDPLKYMKAADLVVSMAGYNTLSEALYLGRRVVALPRVSPRVEQLIRSQRLGELGLVDWIHPARLTPARLADRVRKGLQAGPTTTPTLNFTAIDQIAAVLSQFLNGWQQRLAAAQPHTSSIAATEVSA